MRILLLTFLLVGGVQAANPSYQSFDTNYFVWTNGGFIGINTNRIAIVGVNGTFTRAGTNASIVTNSPTLLTISSDVSKQFVTNVATALGGVGAQHGSVNLTNWSQLTTNVFYPSNNPAGFAPSNALGSAAYSNGAAFVLKAGDTMSGALTITAGGLTNRNGRWVGTNAVNSSYFEIGTNASMISTNGTGANQLWTMTNGATYQSGVASVAGVTNRSLTASRLIYNNASGNEVSATANGAVPIDADGTATTFAQINALGPANIISNNYSVAAVMSNAWTFYQSPNLAGKTNYVALNGDLIQSTNAQTGNSITSTNGGTTNTANIQSATLNTTGNVKVSAGIGVGSSSASGAGNIDMSGTLSTSGGISLSSGASINWSGEVGISSTAAKEVGFFGSGFASMATLYLGDRGVNTVAICITNSPPSLHFKNGTRATYIPITASNIISTDLITATNGFQSWRSNQVALYSVPLGSSPYSWVNTNNCNVFALLAGGTVSAITLNGTTLPAAFLTGSDTLPMQTNETLTITYTVAPTVLIKPF